MRGDRNTQLTSGRISMFSLFGLTTCLGITLNPATRLSISSKKERKGKLPKNHIHLHNTLTSEKKVYTNAKDITHWVMREEQCLRPSLRDPSGSSHGAATERV
jgi:hypothetical protein